MSAGALAATLLTASPAAAVTTSQLVSTSQDVTTSVVQQTPSTADSSNSANTDNSSSTTTAPQSSASPSATVAAVSDGPVGIAQWGQWGRPINTADPGTEYSTTPILVKTDGVLKGKTVTAIAGGAYFKLALCSDGTLVSWGDNSADQLGNRTIKSSRDPVLVDRSAMGKKKVVAIAAGDAHGMALCSDGTVYLWGYNFADGGAPMTGRDNLYTATPKLFQPAVLRGRKVIALACGALHGLALCSDGALVCWGSYFDTGKFSMAARSGRFDLPMGTDFNQYNVAHVVNNQGLLKGKKIVAIAAGYENNLVLCDDGTLAQWGDGLYGDATGDMKDLRAHPENYLRLEPVAVDTSGILAGKTISAIAISNYTDLVLCTDGTLASWGTENKDGSFGNSSESSNSKVPVLVDTSGVLNGKTITAIARIDSSGSFYSDGFMALCADGTVAAWGVGKSGQLGNGQSGVKYFSPVPVLVDESGVLSGKQILAITEGAVLFK
jgi:alpha-tubulin suppressor-like RCC1 family protein